MGKLAKKEYLLESSYEIDRLVSRIQPKEWIKKYLLPHIIGKQSISILDVGCGPGILASTLAKDYPNFKITGVDANQKRIDYAKNIQHTSNVRFKVCNACNLPFLENSFDIVLSRFMVEYIKDIDTPISEMYRVCKPGGKVIIQDIDYQMQGVYPTNDWPQEVDYVFEVMKNEGVFNRNVGRMLFTHMHNAQLKKINVKIEGYDVVTGDPSKETIDHFSQQFDASFSTVSQIVGSDIKARSIIDRVFKHLLDKQTFNFSLLFTDTRQK